MQSRWTLLQKDSSWNCAWYTFWFKELQLNLKKSLVIPKVFRIIVCKLVGLPWFLSISRMFYRTKIIFRIIKGKISESRIPAIPHTQAINLYHYEILPPMRKNEDITLNIIRCIQWRYISTAFLEAMEDPWYLHNTHTFRRSITKGKIQGRFLIFWKQPYIQCKLL